MDLLSRRVLLCLCLCLLVCVAAALAPGCSVEPSAWTLLRFNLGADSPSTGNTRMIEVDGESMKKLSSLNTKLALVSIMGPYRTGKSTLLNQLLPKDVPSNVFSVGHTVQPHTEEVSMYVLPPCVLSASALPPDTSLVYLDTPGLFAPNRVALFDAQLLAILNLVSSVVLYNNFGVIKRSEIEQLADAVEAAFALSYYGEDGNAVNTADQIDRPHLIWCMQNMQVELKDREGNNISTKTYIQNILTDIDAAGNSSTAYSSRMNKFFASLDSFPLPFPSEKYTDSQRLNELKEEQLTQQYRQARELLNSKVLHLANTKKLGKNVLNGAMLASLILTWTEHVNVPTETGLRPRSASILLEHINTKEINKAVTKYKEYMRVVRLPLSDAELRQSHEKAVNDVLSSIPNFNDLPDFLSGFRKAADVLYTEYVKINEGNMRDILNSKFTDLQTAHTNKVKALVLPLTQQAIRQIEEETRSMWAQSIDKLRGPAASLLPEYEIKVNEMVQPSTQSLVSQSAEIHHSRIKQKHADALNVLILPVESSVIQQMQSEALAAWNVVTQDLSSLPTAYAAQLTSSLSQTLSDQTAAITLKNKEASVSSCISTAKHIAHDILTSSEDWMKDRRYQSYNTFTRLLEQSSHTQFCVGPGINDTQVAYQFYKVRKTIAEAIQQRVMFTQILYLVTVLAAVYALRVMHRLCTYAPYTQHQYSLITDQSKGGDSLPHYTNGHHSSSHASVSSASGFDKLYGYVCLALPCCCLYVGQLIPDAATGMYLHMLYGAIGVLILSFLVTLWASMKLCCRQGKSTHEH